jgi:hypothetical protein
MRRLVFTQRHTEECRQPKCRFVHERDSYRHSESAGPTLAVSTVKPYFESKTLSPFQLFLRPVHDGSSAFDARSSALRVLIRIKISNVCRIMTVWHPRNHAVSGCTCLWLRWHSTESHHFKQPRLPRANLLQPRISIASELRSNFDVCKLTVMQHCDADVTVLHVSIIVGCSSFSLMDDQF